MWSTAQASQLPRIKINNFHFYLLFTCLVVLFAPIWIRVNYGQYARNSKLHEPDSYLVTSHAIYLYLQRSVFSHNLLFVDLLIINGSTNMNKSVKFVMFFLSLVLLFCISYITSSMFTYCVESVLHCTQHEAHAKCTCFRLIFRKKMISFRKSSSYNHQNKKCV